MKLRHVLCLLLVQMDPAWAQAEASTAMNARVQQVDYVPGQVVVLRGTPGYQLMVELSADEQVKSVAVGNSAAWQINVSKEGNRLFVKPVREATNTNMAVITSIRTYSFDLEVLPEQQPDMPYAITFRYPSSEPAHEQPFVDVAAVRRRLSNYRITGDPQLRPASVVDDGRHTYVQWPVSAPIPAVYSVDASGQEVLVNGMMRPDDVYVVDGVPSLLTFRIDKALARAERVRSRKAR